MDIYYVWRPSLGAQWTLSSSSTIHIQAGVSALSKNNRQKSLSQHYTLPYMHMAWQHYWLRLSRHQLSMQMTIGTEPYFSTTGNSLRQQIIAAGMIQYLFMKHVTWQCTVGGRAFIDIHADQDSTLQQNTPYNTYVDSNLRIAITPWMELLIGTRFTGQMNKDDLSTMDFSYKNTSVHTGLEIRFDS